MLIEIWGFLHWCFSLNGLQDFVNLKGIDLTASTQLMELPDLSKATKLEIQNIAHCVNLSHVHPSILSLDTLVDFVLYGCKKLKSLHLRSVKYIVLNGCFNLQEFSLTSGEINVLNLRGTAIETLAFPSVVSAKLKSSLSASHSNMFQRSYLLWHVLVNWIFITADSLTCQICITYLMLCVLSESWFWTSVVTFLESLAISSIFGALNTCP